MSVWGRGGELKYCANCKRTTDHYPVDETKIIMECRLCGTKKYPTGPYKPIDAHRVAKNRSLK